MQYTDERAHLRIEFEAEEFGLEAGDLMRMEQELLPVEEAVQELPTADLRVKVIRHPQTQAFHVEFRLRVPGRTLFTGDWDDNPDGAFRRCVNKIVRKVNAYKEHPDERAEEVALHVGSLEQNIVAPTDPDAGPLGKAVSDGDYMRFRTELAGYEEWLRNRIGRWVQRYPDVETRIGKDLKLGDLLEEVYLNAFERYPGRPTEKSLSEWLESLMDPSLKALLRHPDEERENINMVRSLREAPK